MGTLRKPLFINATEGFHEEMAADDTLTLGGLSMSGNIDLDGYNKIINSAAATQAGDVLVYGQNGGNLGNNTTFGTGTTLGNNTTLGSTTLNSTLNMNNNDLYGLPGTPGGPTSAASKSYVDSVAQGLDVHPSCHLQVNENVSLSGLSDIDGHTPVDGDRILVTGQTDPKENGIYIAHSGAWTRASDLATGSNAAGAFVFVEAGDVYGKTGWVCTSIVPTDVVGTDDLPWAQFAGAGTYTAGDGLKLIGSVFSANLSTTPGLQISGGKLEAKVDGTNGMAKSSGGLYVKTDGTTIGFNGSGELKSLTSGSSEAVVMMNVTTSLPVAVGDPVYWSADNKVAPADCANDLKAHVIGVAITADNAGGGTVNVVVSGTAAGVLSGATVNTNYYLQTTHGVGTSLPGSGKRVMVIGRAQNVTDLWVDIIDYGKKA